MHPLELRSRRILISPLNWGFGHLSRCIPLINRLIKNGNQLYFAGERNQISIIKQYFSTLHCIEFLGYPFHFRSEKSFRQDILRQIPSHLKRYKEELREVNQLCDQYDIQIVISDHRYGFRSKKARSIFLTHQVNLPLRWYEFPFQSLHRRWMKKFDEIWIIDDETFNYAGNLSKAPKHLSASYIGTLSRFEFYNDEHGRRNGGVVIVVSGPILYATKFALEQSKIYDNETVCMILPPELGNLMFSSNIQIVTSENWRQCDKIILNATKIVSRSGYSTLMDLIQLRVPFFIIPTPGQTEQEYLFNHWSIQNNLNGYRISQ
jgi:uncharacterized protein (TIGR00661 family)